MYIQCLVLLNKGKSIKFLNLLSSRKSLAFALVILGISSQSLVTKDTTEESVKALYEKEMADFIDEYETVERACKKKEKRFRADVKLVEFEFKKQEERLKNTLKTAERVRQREVEFLEHCHRKKLDKKNHEIKKLKEKKEPSYGSLVGNHKKEAMAIALAGVATGLATMKLLMITTRSN